MEPDILLIRHKPKIKFSAAMNLCLKLFRLTRSRVDESIEHGRDRKDGAFIIFVDLEDK